ncbi:unannotated protein [freshwater metagenome]|uniref:Unannotated protein n=1 Tax=freshwater metagenome TaxID=449393 RepID=A0A6J7UX76_9ZZZZ
MERRSGAIDIFVLSVTSDFSGSAVFRTGRVAGITVYQKLAIQNDFVTAVTTICCGETLSQPRLAQLVV